MVKPRPSAKDGKATRIAPRLRQAGERRARGPRRGRRRWPADRAASFGEARRTRRRTGSGRRARSRCRSRWACQASLPRRGPGPAAREMDAAFGLLAARASDRRADPRRARPWWCRARSRSTRSPARPADGAAGRGRPCARRCRCGVQPASGLILSLPASTSKTSIAARSPVWCRLRPVIQASKGCSASSSGLVLRRAQQTSGSRRVQVAVRVVQEQVGACRAGSRARPTGRASRPPRAGRPASRRRASPSRGTAPAVPGRPATAGAAARPTPRRRTRPGRCRPGARRAATRARMSCGAGPGQIGVQAGGAGGEQGGEIKRHPASPVGRGRP